MSGPRIDKVGRRFYLRALPYAARGIPRSMGCTWDAEASCWWTGKEDRAEAVLAKVKATPAQPIDPMLKEMRGGCRWKGRLAYWSWCGRPRSAAPGGPQRIRLHSPDGTVDWWADVSDPRLSGIYNYGSSRRTGNPRTKTLAALAKAREETRRTRACEALVKQGHALSWWCWSGWTRSTHTPGEVVEREGARLYILHQEARYTEDGRSFGGDDEEGYLLTTWAILDERLPHLLDPAQLARLYDLARAGLWRQVGELVEALLVEPAEEGATP